VCDVRGGLLCVSYYEVCSCVVAYGVSGWKPLDAHLHLKITLQIVELEDVEGDEHPHLQ
jgi:hypothetical protein